MKKSIIDALVEHHEEIRDLMEKGSNNREAFLRLKKHLDIHHQIEEDILLSKLNEMDGIKDESLESQEEHFVLNMLLLDLADFPIDHKRWPVKYKVMSEIIEHHLDEEEEDLFPEAKEMLEKSVLEEMGTKFIELKEKQMQVL